MKITRRTGVILADKNQLFWIFPKAMRLPPLDLGQHPIKGGGGGGVCSVGFFRAREAAPFGPVIRGASSRGDHACREGAGRCQTADRWLRYVEAGDTVGLHLH